MLQRQLGEFSIVFKRRLHPEVERPFRIGALVADLFEAAVQRLAVFVIRSDVGARVDASCDRQLCQRRCIDEAEHADRIFRRLLHRLELLDLAREDEVTDAVAGQRQRFAVRIRNDRIVVVLRRIRDDSAIVRQFSVRLVCDEVDGMAVFRTLAGEHFADLFQRFLAVDDAGRIVRRVDDDRAGVLVDQRLHVRRIRLEGWHIGGHDQQLTAEVVHVVRVIAEERRKGNDFRSRIEDRLKEHVQTAGRADRHHDVLRGEGCAVQSVEVVCDRFPRAGIPAAARAVTVDPLHRFLVEDRLDGILDFIRRRNAGIADAEIIDVLFAVLLDHLRNDIEHTADARITKDERFHCFCDHSSFLLSYYVVCSSRKASSPCRLRCCKIVILQARVSPRPSCGRR